MNGSSQQECPPESALKDRWEMFFKACGKGDLAASDFELGDPVDVPPEDRKKQIPDSARLGIYYYLNHKDEVLYVGLATEAFGTRFWDHIKKVDRDRGGHGWGTARRFKTRRLRSELPQEKLVQMGALEAYLIATLRPPLNTTVGGAAVHASATG